MESLLPNNFQKLQS